MIEAALQPLTGIRQLRPDYLARKLRIEHEPSLDAELICQTIQRTGFEATLFQGHDQVEVEAPRRAIRVDLWIATALLLIAMLFALVNLSHLVPAFAIAAVVLAGIPVAKNAWRAVCLRQLDMNALLTVASIGAVLTGEWLEAATGMVLFRFSLVIDEASKRKANDSIRALMNLAPATAHRLESDRQTLTVVPVELLEVGQIIRVLPGERVPIDGKVIAGQSSVNEATITGESMPVNKEPGENLYGGSLNQEGSLDVEVRKSATDSTPARISRLIADAQANRSPTERFVDRFAQVYTPAVIAFAVALSLLPWLVSAIAPQYLSMLGDGSFSEVWRAWFRRALVMLVIACPCALVLSTPITVVCGLYQASRRGILVKGGEFLELMGRVRRIALDKTGTLTVGNPKVVRVEVCGDLSVEELLGQAAALEQHSEHPLARAIVEAAEAATTTTAVVESFEVLRGYGVRGKVNQLEMVVASGNYLQTLGVETVDDGDAVTRAYVVQQGRLQGYIEMSDELRPDAVAAIEEWRSLGVEQTVMLTGDRESVARRVAQELGVDRFLAELLPDDKIVRVRELTGQHKDLVMVGDGVNDAPALAAAPIGIALGTAASDTALETSDVVIMQPLLTRISDLIRLSRQTRAILIQNISIALGVKLVVLGLAAVDYATMWMAVGADVGASFLVIANGTRLLKVKQESMEPPIPQEAVAP
ncbi:MAG: heavy metal translocating P-type ATPase [Planctomycetaceae bacterium]|nr:heavy metal translocating P-type ATPase [Planctomycetaceae bacterium]